MIRPLPVEPVDRIPIKPGRTLQVVRVRNDDTDQAPVLIVEDLREQGGLSED